MCYQSLYLTLLESYGSSPLDLSLRTITRAAPLPFRMWETIGPTPLAPLGSKSMACGSLWEVNDLVRWCGSVKIRSVMNRIAEKTELLMSDPGGKQSQDRPRCKRFLDTHRTLCGKMGLATRQPPKALHPRDHCMHGSGGRRSRNPS